MEKPAHLVWEAESFLRGFVEERWEEHASNVKITCTATMVEIYAIGHLPQKEGVEACMKLVSIPVLLDEIAFTLWKYLVERAMGPNVFERFKVEEEERAAQQVEEFLQYTRNMRQPCHCMFRSQEPEPQMPVSFREPTPEPRPEQRRKKRISISRSLSSFILRPLTSTTSPPGTPRTQEELGDLPARTTRLSKLFRNSNLSGSTLTSGPSLTRRSSSSSLRPFLMRRRSSKRPTRFVIGPDEVEYPSDERGRASEEQ